MTFKLAIARWILFAAALAGGSYLLPVVTGATDLLSVVWKGSGVALLAIYCALVARTRDGWLLSGIMALGAAGDVLLEVASLETGAVAFAIGHILAIFLYVRNRRNKTTPSQIALAALLIVATPAIGWWLTLAPGVAFYSTLLGLMAASAWLSRFSRFRTGIGAVMFVASDLLIFARTGPLANASWPDFAIWALYFAGQFLIVQGVSSRLSQAEESRSLARQG